MELLKQPQFSAITVYEQIVLIFAGVRGYLDILKIDDILPFKEYVMKHINSNAELTSYDLNGDLPELLIETFLESALKDFNTERTQD